MADVFISYKRGDAAKVRKLVAALRAAGLDTWWDEDIPPSAPWEATIEAELARAKAVIVCWSPDAVASDNVRSEARVAREDGRLIQVFMKPCQPPLFFGEQQGLDLGKWRGNADDPRIARLVETARKVAAGERIEAGERPKHARRLDLRLAGALAALLLLVIAGGAGWWLLSAGKAEGPQTLAVLPFRALNPADANLVDAIWDDTRGAISHNPNLRVLGRQAMEALARKGLEPADYRKKVGADYLLDGNVQRAGDRVLMNVSLTRTSDGAEVWSDSIGGKLDDVFAFQQRIAREVEGRIRGRVAPGGGRTSKNIATSAEVYEIYAEARAKIRRRNSEDAHAAIILLKKAVALDPNYAPAWADLGEISGMGISRRPDFPPSMQRTEAVADLKRALELAPNLAHAHAVLATIHGFPQERELKRAVELDPNDAEAWNWLGNFYQNENRLEEALQAHRRAAEIEPLWDVTVVNVVGDLSLMKDWQAVDAELKRIEARGDPVLTAKAKGMPANLRGEIGEVVNGMLRLKIEHPDQAPWVDTRIFHPLMQLGFIEEAFAAWGGAEGGWPAEDVKIYRGTPPPAQLLRNLIHDPRKDMWEADDDSMALFGRLLPRNGRLKEYVGYYDAAFKSPNELFDYTSDHPGFFLATAPTLAANLRAAGRDADADAILRHAEEVFRSKLTNGKRSPSDIGMLAHIRGAEGRDDEALALLREAVADSDLPDRMWQATDIAEEPCFARLVNRPDFQAIRRHILARIEEERRKVRLDLLAKAYPVKRQVAA